MASSKVSPQKQRPPRKKSAVSKKKAQRRKINKYIRISERAAFIIQALLSLIMLVTVGRTGMLPWKYLVLIFLGLTVLAAITFAMNLKRNRKVRLAGTGISVIAIIVTRHTPTKLAFSLTAAKNPFIFSPPLNDSHSFQTSLACSRCMYIPFLRQKNPARTCARGQYIRQQQNMDIVHDLFKTRSLFFHPDYTVGPGVSPSQPPKRVADFTASREFHPAPKNIMVIQFPKAG